MNLALDQKKRIDSIDLLRGIIMVLMLLDHARDFFHQYAMVYDPEDLSQTTPIIFYTRWITHLCAPTFVILAGLSAFLFEQKTHSKKDVQRYLITRGIFLILLEETIINIAWRLSIDLTTIRGLVIWALGWSMIALAGLLYFNRKTILILSLIILLFHNLLDPIHFENKFLQSIWSFLHQSDRIEFLSADGTVFFTWRILYPVLPMVGLIGVGYYIGEWFSKDFKSDIRQGMLWNSGLILISAFVLLRFLQYVFIQYDYIFYFSENDIIQYNDSNNTFVFKHIKYAFKVAIHYFTSHMGDPKPMVPQEEFSYTIMSFLNVSKYPFSLLYCLITIGPVFLLWSWLDGAKLPVWMNQLFKTIGSVPLFYYIVHLFWLRILALLIILIFYTQKMPLALNGQIRAFSEITQMNIFMVYFLTILSVAVLYPLCKWYGAKKKKGNSIIYSYI